MMQITYLITVNPAEDKFTDDEEIGEEEAVGNKFTAGGSVAAEIDATGSAATQAMTTKIYKLFQPGGRNQKQSGCYGDG